MTKTKMARTKIFIALIVLCLVAGAAFYFLRQNENSDTLDVKPTNIGKADTYEATTEDQVIAVPDNVDPSSIKPYKLITENESFKIRELDGVYTITLYAIINRPDQADYYRDQLREYKSEALKYLQNNGVDTSKVKINYDPDEAKNL